METYHYDLLDRLTNVEACGYSDRVVDYDAIGNIEFNSTQLEYDWNGSPSLREDSLLGGSRTRGYSYGKDGRLRQVEENDGSEVSTTTRTLDAWNRSVAREVSVD